MKKTKLNDTFDIIQYVNYTPFTPSSPYNDTENMIKFYHYVEDWKDQEQLTITEQARFIGMPTWLYSRWYGWALEAKRYKETVSCYMAWIKRHPEDEHMIEEIEDGIRVFDPVRPYFIPSDLNINPNEIWEDLSNEMSKDVVRRRVAEIRNTLILSDIYQLREEEALAIFNVIDLEKRLLAYEESVEWDQYNIPEEDDIILGYEDEIENLEKYENALHNRALDLCSLIGVRLEEL